jgi:hypothetical protein
MRGYLGSPSTVKVTRMYRPMKHDRIISSYSSKYAEDRTGIEKK